MEYRVVLVESAPETVLRVPREIRPNPYLLGEDVAEGMRELTRIAQRAGLTASGAPTITFTHELPADESIAVDFGVPVEPAPNLGPSYGAQVVVMPGTLVARTCHHGSYRDLGAAYLALQDWMREAGYRPIGPPTEAYLIGPDEVTDPRRLLTEIRLPVARAPTIAVHLASPFDDVVERTRKALRQQGLSVIAEIDIRAMLRENIGEHIENYVMLSVCDPRSVHQALLADRHAGLQPYGVVVRSVDTGTLVEATDPEAQARPTTHPTHHPVAASARRLLAAALDDLLDTNRDAARTDRSPHHRR
ncbi:GyrI-like domain-containing protein [Nocardia sp. CNY236]|uniref:GyrI-like domain-containing protein n=1 Tax=Nocardia sp. CNY236 TaxID=1169152 RepID=UPI0003F4F2FE|nr:GyrI-like domain-containing protein [Nocardia sp. CNY236]